MRQVRNTNQVEREGQVTAREAALWVVEAKVVKDGKTISSQKVYQVLTFSAQEAIGGVVATEQDQGREIVVLSVRKNAKLSTIIVDPAIFEAAGYEPIKASENGEDPFT